MQVKYNRKRARVVQECHQYDTIFHIYEITKINLKRPQSCARLSPHLGKVQSKLDVWNVFLTKICKKFKLRRKVVISEILLAWKGCFCKTRYRNWL